MPVKTGLRALFKSHYHSFIYKSIMYSDFKYQFIKNSLLLLITIISLHPIIVLSDSETQLWDKLKQGGLVIVMRHSAVIKSKQHGQPMLRDPSCRKEIKLSAKGKLQAAYTGKLFSIKNIPVEEVLTSPYCRTIETAKIAFSKNRAVDFLILLDALPQTQAEANTKTLSQRIGSYSGKGNLIIITHAPNINAISFETIETGEFIVFTPMGNNEFEEAGKIKAAQ